MKPIIEFKNFTFQYHAQAEPTLYDINLSIKAGEKVLIVGASGSGKSTLVACINGLIPHSYEGEISGELIIAEKQIIQRGLFERSKLVGTVLQDLDSQFIGLTVGEDIAFSLENDKILPKVMHEQVERAAERVKIDSLLEQEPYALSGGQKQKVSLAGVLVNNVPILLLDEPLANLDPRSGQEAISLIDQLSMETGATTLIVEHRLEDVLYKHIDRIVLIADGRIVADMTPNEMLAGNLLRENGIREPLYVSALKMAGVTLTEEKNPESLSQLILSDSDKEYVRSWYQTPVKQVDETRKKEKLLSIKNLSFQYERDYSVLEDVTFDIGSGEFLAIVGQNGAGKSTLSKLICGFEKLDEGVIQFKNQDIAQKTIAERAKHIGYVMQNPNQMISKSQIFDEVALGLKTSNLTKKEIIEKVHEVLKICGLYEMRHWPISALSFGQKKRMTIASILVLEPELLILDEPTAGQDYQHYTEIMSFLESLNVHGITIIIITHDMHLVLEYARRVLVFGDHKLLADCTPSELFVQTDLLTQANLKETSLYTLAGTCHIPESQRFIQHFIELERENRNFCEVDDG